MTPLVSIVIALYDHERYVGEAIESVFGQTYEPVEVIVVDDGSDDGAAEVAARAEPRLQLFRQPHAGIGAARNRGVAAATGSYLAFLDADDRYPPDRLSRHVAALERDPALDGGWGEIAEFLDPAADRVAARLREPVTRPARMMMSTTLRRPAFDAVGPFAETMGRGLELDWLARADEHGLRLAAVPGTAVERRLHGANTGIRDAGAELDYVHALRAALARRRSAAPR
jgi:glycosyltransferase involved in cell wall biosynthesis